MRETIWNGKLLVIVCLLVVAAIGLGACQAGATPAATSTPAPQSTAEPTEATTPTEVPTEAPTEAPQEEATPAQANTVQVGLTEYTIDMPSSLPAGPTTFEVTNNGTFNHNFEIEGQGIEQVFDTNLQPGETRTVQVDLAVGTYDVYCPVDGHADRGMRLELTVGGESYSSY